MAAITPPEAEAIDAANASGCQPVVFVHGLWLLSNTWDPWRKFFEEAGYSTVAPSWPGDPDTVQEGNANPDRFAGTTVGQVAAHLELTIGTLTMPPVVIGHSFGGLLVQILAGRPYARAGAIEDQPVVATLDIVAGDPTHRQRHFSVGTGVGEGGVLPRGSAVDRHVLAEDRRCVRRLAELAFPGGYVPCVAQEHASGS